MTNSQSDPAVNVEIIAAPSEQEPILANLLELYIHDFSELIELELDAGGHFGYRSLPLYWKEPDRYPFLVKVNDNLAGFVFLHKESQITGDKQIWDMAEFFIVRGYRRRGVGKKAAHEIWKRFPGKWEVRVIDKNQKAKEFWERSISEFVGQTIIPTLFQKGDRCWHVFAFESK